MSTSPSDKSSTPGPWTTRDTHDNSTEISSEHFSGRVLATVHAPVVMNSDNDHEEAANARLIASAPDLLAALQEMMAVHGHMVNCFPDIRPCGELCQLVRAAIAKATGEQS